LENRAWSMSQSAGTGAAVSAFTASMLSLAVVPDRTDGPAGRSSAKFEV